MEFLPWRDQVKLGWRYARWAIWLPDAPLWAQLVYKIAQITAIIGGITSSWWIVGAAFALAWITACITAPS